MDFPFPVPGTGAIVPKIRTVAAQSASELETAVQRLIDAAATADPSSLVAGFALGGGGAGGLITAALSFTTAADLPAGEIGEIFYDDATTPIDVALTGGGAWDPVLGAFTLIGAINFTMPTPGVLQFNGTAASLLVQYSISPDGDGLDVPDLQAGVLLDPLGAPVILDRSVMSCAVENGVNRNVSNLTTLSMVDGDQIAIGLRRPGAAQAVDVPTAHMLVVANPGTASNGNAASFVPSLLARVAIVEVMSPDGVAQEPGSLLQARIATLNPTGDNLVQETQVVLPSAAPKCVLGALYRNNPAPQE